MKRVLATIALGVVGAFVFGAAPAAAAPGDEPAPAPFVMPEEVTLDGMTDADRIFLQKVRQAGLWEIPSGQQAVQKGSTPRVREVGQLIANDHVVLDDDVRRVAARLGVQLPNEATPEQKLWMEELTAKTGKAFDRAFAQRLRYAHGAVYKAIADVRAFTRNPVMRAFATQCEIFVQRHMRLLESTGEVAYHEMPLPVVAEGNLRAAEKKQPLMLIALFAITGAIGVAGVARAVRGAN